MRIQNLQSYAHENKFYSTLNGEWGIKSFFRGIRDGE